MTNLMRHALVTILLGFAIAVATGARADVSSGDSDSIRAIIQSQISAFQRDDGMAAYSYASPTIQGLFPSPDRFMTMVRNGYAPVYRPRSFAFGAVVETPSGPVQRVYLTGPDGRNWVALYTLQKQPDGSWKINGCQLIVDEGGEA